VNEHLLGLGIKPIDWSICTVQSEPVEASAVTAMDAAAATAANGV